MTTVWLTARPVHPARSAFVRLDGQSWGGERDAAEYVRSLASADEPVLLRLEVHGRPPTSPDWLCDPGKPPAAIPRPRWSFSVDSLEWSSTRRWIDAWELCVRADWMVHAAASCGVPTAACVLAVCGLVRASSADPGDAARAALGAASAWASGAGSAAAAGSAAPAAESYAMECRARGYDALAAAASAAASVARAASHGASTMAASVASSHMVRAAQEASSAAALDSLSGGRRRASMAESLRSGLPTAEVLRAASRRR